MTATETLPLSGQALHHLDEMAEHQHQHHCDMSGLAWGFLWDLDYGPVDGPVFAARWAEYVRLRAALESGGPMWNWRESVRRTLTVLAGEPR